MMNAQLDQLITRDQLRACAAALARQIERNILLTSYPEDLTFERYAPLSPWRESESIDGEPE